jgi:hypothetical protein
VVWLIFNDISEDIAASIFNKIIEQWIVLKVEAAKFTCTLVPL